MSHNKDLDPDGIDKAAKACEDKGCVIVYGGLVKKINETDDSESKRILIVSDTFITFVKKPMFPEISHLRSWSDLTSISFIEKDGLALKFKKNNKDLQFRFRSRERQVIVRKIIDLLYHTLNPVELQVIDHLIDFQHPPISINPRGVLSRFDEHMVKNGAALDQSKLRAHFKLYCQLPRPNFVPKSIETRQEMKALFFALMGSYFTKSVFFPQIKNEELTEKMFKYLDFFVNSPGVTEFFSFSNTLTSKFDGFLKSILAKSETPINGIGFRGVEMPEESVEKVKKLVGEKGLFSLRWCDISPETSCESLLKDRKVRKSLRYLAFDRTKGISFRKIAPRLSHIVVLSLEYSGLEITDVFKLINKNNLNQLRMINLSFNNATKPFDSSIIIPSRLQRIDISHVKFNNGAMKNILEVILTAEYENGLKFYCDKYHDEDEEIDDTLENLQNKTSEHLLEFSWRKNKVDKNLLNFLKGCPKLCKLILEGNIKINEEQGIVQDFAKIIPSFKSLTHLYVCGSKSGELKTDFENQLIQSLKGLPKLTLLDISNNSISDQGIESIALSLKELPSLTHIILDNNKITSIDPLRKLAEKAQQIHRKLFISWPLNDIKSLLRDEKVTESELSDLKARFTNASTGSFMLPSNRLPMTLDDGVVIDSKNSSSVRNKSIKGKQKKQKGGSVFIRAGSVRNLKRAIAQEDEREQDPDSIFIQPFDVWFNDINGTNFPLYLTEDLVSEFDVQKYDPEDNQDNDETEFEFDEEENSDVIQSRSIKVSNNSDSENDNREAKPTKTNQRNSSSDDDDDRNMREKQLRQNNLHISDSEDEDRSKQRTRKFVKAPPPLKPVEEVLNSPSKQNQRTQGSSSRNQSLFNSSSDKINNDDNDEPGEVKERNISISQKSNDKLSYDAQLASRSTSSQKPKRKTQKFPSPNYSQSQKHTLRSVTQMPAPTLNLDYELADATFGDQVDEVEPFEAPSWSFPVPRVTRVSNNSFLSELNDKYSVASVINDLRSKKK